MNITDDDLFSEIGNKKGKHLTGIYYKPDEKTLKLLRHLMCSLRS